MAEVKAESKGPDNRRRRNWVFTYYFQEDYPDAGPDIAAQCLKGLIDDNPMNFLACQVEQCPETDRLHIQGYLHLHEAMTFTALKAWCTKVGLLEGAHWEQRKGSHKQALDYVTKTDTRVHGPYIWGREPSQGDRTDFKIIKAAIDEGKDLDHLYDEHTSIMFRYDRSINAYLNRKQRAPTRQVTNVIWYGPPGVGKTTAAKGYAEKIFGKGVPIYYSRSGFFCDYADEKVILFDDFHTERWDYNVLLAIMDGNPTMLPRKLRGPVPCKAELVLFTSNQEPAGVYSNHVHTPHMRRFDHIFSVESLPSGVSKKGIVESRKWDWGPD